MTQQKKIDLDEEIELYKFIEYDDFTDEAIYWQITKRDLLKAVLPILDRLQKDFRGLVYKKPQYREKWENECFYAEGDLEYVEAIAFLNYIKTLVQER